jgi:hypothetical protein
MIRVGFTGTRFGMTKEQKLGVYELLVEMAGRFRPLEAHHGMCDGADWQFHVMAQTGVGARMVGHPGPGEIGDARLKFDFVLPPATHMKRNKTIVLASDYMIATPREALEQLRSGTWATIRMARKANKPLAVVEPSGLIKWSNW